VNEQMDAAVSKFIATGVSCLLSACSSVCLVQERPGSNDVFVYTRYDIEHQVGQGNENDKLLNSCEQKSSYRYSQGSIFFDLIPSFSLGSKPACLLKKAKNDVLTNEGLVLVEDNCYQYEAGLQYTVSTFICPEGIRLNK
jgi:hypothetical protein